MTKQIVLPPQTIGIIGGGQLGRMMAIAGRYMGYQIAVLDPTPNCPTAQVADQHIVAAYDDMEAIKALTEASDVITYEFENVDLKAARYIEEQGKLPQGAYALEITQNRENEKTLMRDAGVKVPNFYIVHNEAECEAALNQVTLPAVIKTCTGGYDGKGQLKIESEADFVAAKTFASHEGSFIIEEWIRFDKEISTVFSRSHDGHIEFFPIAENEHRDHILYETIAPAHIPEELADKAKAAASRLAEKINVIGTFAIEMFVKGDDIYINEMAPRPHNSGHYTIEACNISQFSQHIRAICGLPLIDVKLMKSALMKNILGEDLDKVLEKMKTATNGFVHLYGKDNPQAKRKMGHITLIADDLRELKKFKQNWFH